MTEARTIKVISRIKMAAFAIIAYADDDDAQVYMLSMQINTGISHDMQWFKREFELHSRYYVPIRINTFAKGMNPLILTAMD